MGATRLLLLRHGETDWNRSRLMQGQADIDLNEAGVEQAKRVAAALADREVSAVYSSDLIRARRTAEIVAQRWGLAVQVDSRLQEINVGDWSGWSVSQVKAEQPAFEEMFKAGVDFRRSRTGETLAEVGARGTPAIREIGARHVGEQVLVVSHGLLITTVMQELIGLDAAARALGIPGNAHYCELGIDEDRAWVIAHNLAG